MSKTTPDPGQVRHRRLRLALDRLNALLRGWRFAAATPHPRQAWAIVAAFSGAIRQRPELGEMNQNRIDNMRLACRALDGVVLPPGRALSLRRCLGEPSEARGYRRGPMLTGNRLGSSAGGGLCQVSTVLFNAALRAGLEILERHAHSTDPWGAARAFPLGLDATFVHARLDLKIRNRHPFPVQLTMEVPPCGDRLDAAFLAPAPLAGPVEVRTAILARLDPPQGDWGPGWIVETVRLDPSGQVSYRQRSRYAPFVKPGGDA